MPVISHPGGPPQADRRADEHGDDQQRQPVPVKPPVSASTRVAARAMAMPAMPNMLPAGAVSCRDSPARARMNSSAATMYAALAADCGGHRCVSSARNMASMRWVTAKPPKTLMLASRIADGRHERDHEGGLADLQQRADEDDAGDRVGHRHQRGVQRVVHVPDDVVADHDGQREDRQVADERGRRERREQEQHRGGDADDARTAAPAASAAWPPDRRRGAAAAAAAGAAETWTGGGGQVISPVAHHGHAALDDVVEVQDELAVLARGEQLHQVDQVGAVELARPGRAAGPARSV